MTTTTNWREMEAGLELDWIVAQADGWHDDGKERLGENPGHSKLWIGLIKEGEPDLKSVTFNKSDGSIWLLSTPHYSTDLNAAMTLVTPLTRLECRQSHTGETVFACCMAKSYDEPQTWHWARTPALAICRAFLAWKEAHS